MDGSKNRNEYFKAYREANRERLNEYQRQYNKVNKLKNYKRLATYYRRKAEEMEATQNEENIDIRNES